MPDDPGEGIFRAMREANDGMPMLGTSTETLTIRKNKDIVPDPAGIVSRPSFEAGKANGLSCAPTIHDLPRFLVPRVWGGRNRRTVVWRIDAADLGPDLIAAEDSAPGRPMRHISVGPARSMGFDEYVRQIDSTRPKWQKVPKN